MVPRVQRAPQAHEASSETAERAVQERPSEPMAGRALAVPVAQTKQSPLPESVASQSSKARQGLALHSAPRLPAARTFVERLFLRRNAQRNRNTPRSGRTRSSAVPVGPTNPAPQLKYHPARRADRQLWRGIPRSIKHVMDACK